MGRALTLLWFPEAKLTSAAEAGKAEACSPIIYLSQKCTEYFFLRLYFFKVIDNRYIG